MFLEQLEQRSLLAVLVWDGSASNQWSNPLNWSNDVAPMSGDDLVFPAGASNLANANNLAAGTRFNTILLQGSGYNITGNAIELSGGLTANNAAGSNTFGLNTTLINAQTFMSANAGTTLNVTGNIDTANLIGSYFIGTIPAVVFDGAGALSVTGVISGAGGLSKLGGGTLTLGGANTYEGITEARQGFIRVTNNLGLGSALTAHTEVQAGAAVELSGVTTAEDFSIREGGVGFGSGTDISTAGALRGVGGVLSTVTGNVELVGGNNLIGSTTGSTLNLAGQIMAGLSTGTGRRLLKVGPGTVQFTGNQPNIYPGDTVVLQGRLELGKTGAGADKAIPGNLIIGDNIGGDNAAEARLLASNQLAQLNLFDAALNTITLNSSGVLNLNGFSDTVGSLILTTGTTYSSDIAIGVGTLTLGGNLTLNGFQGSSGATPAATISATGAGQFSLGDLATGGQVGVLTGTVRTFTINDTQLTNIATDLDISANITGPVSTGISKVGAGTLRLGGNNAFAGPFVWNNGIIEVNSNSAFGTGLIALQSNGGNTFRAIGGTRTVANPISVDADNTNFIGSDSLNFTGSVTLVTATPTLRVMDPAQTVTFSGVIGEGIFGSKSLNKGGRGTLVMTAANTYSGTTTINQDGGSLVLRGAGSILNSPTITVNQGGTLTIDNNVLGNLPDRVNDATTINLGADNVGGGRLLFRSAAGANSRETVGTVNVPQNVQGTIEVDNASGGASEALLTLNAFSIANANRHTLFIGTGQALSESGNTRISIINNPGILDDGILPQAVVLGPAGDVDFATYGSSAEGIAIIPLPASAYVTDISQASVTSNVRLTANAALTTSKSVNALLIGPGVVLSGPNSTVTVNSGAIVLGAGSSVSAGNLNTGAGFVTVPTGSATISSSIFSGAVLKGGRGTLVLSGDNQTASNINVNNGVLEISNGNALGSPAGATTVRQGATLQLSGNLNVGLEPLTITGAGFSPNAPGSGLDTYASGIGVIRNVSGNSNWAGTISMGGDATDLTSPALLAGFPVIANGTTFWNVSAGSLNVTGAVVNTVEVIKRGAGQLEYSGVVANTYDATTRILDGTLLLNKEPGVNAVINIVEVGTEAVGAPAATLRLGASDQMRDDRGVRIHPSGLFDLDGNSEVLGTNFELIIGPTNAGDVNIGAGGTLTPNVNTTVFTVGSGGTAGSSITGGTFALQLAGLTTGAVTRTIQVNGGAFGSDLTITSAIMDGSGLLSNGLLKSGFGQLELGGTLANTYTGDTTVNEGVLLLNKGAGTGGVSALAGRVLIGDNNQQSGFASSDIVRLAQPNQIPDFLALVDVRASGMFDLNGNSETIGVADVQNALTMQTGSTVNLGGATLNVIGNIATSTNTGLIGFWTPVVAPRILGGTLSLGAITRTIDVGPDRAEVPYELEITSDITGAGGFITNNSGTLLLSGDNSGLSGDIVRTNGNFALGSDTALGSGRALLNGSITTYGGKRTIATEIVFGANVIGLVGGNNTAGVGAIGGGGNDLTFTGPVNVITGTWQPSVPVAAQVEFAGQLGETLGGVGLRKIGFGTLILSNTVTQSGTLEVGQDFGGGPGTRLSGGTLIIRDQGTVLNMGVTIGKGGVLQVDNSGVNLANRFGETSLIDLFGGTLALVGKAGQPSGEAFGQLRPRNEYDGYVQAIAPAAVGTQATWRFTSLAREAGNQGSATLFTGRGGDISATGANRIALNTTGGLLVNGIIPYGLLSGAGGLDFATFTNPNVAVNPFDNFLAALTSGPNFATTLAGASATINVKLAASEAVAAATTANAILLPGGMVVSGAGALTLNSGLLAATGTNTVSVTSLTLGAAEAVIYVDGADSNLILSSGLTAAGATASLSKAGAGSLELSGANPNLFTGATRVVNGTYRASKDSAFGTTAGNVRVTYGATVELNTVNIPAEQIDLNGTGEANVANVSLRTVAGSGLSTWNGNVALNISTTFNRAAIEVNAGSNLTVLGVVSNQGLNKTGAGTLQLAGTAANTFAGGGLVIWQGTVEANKNNAGAGANILNTNTTVGDNVGGPNADRLVLLFTNQIPDANNVTVTSTGSFDYGTVTETINAFNLQMGLVSSGTITGSTGVLTINANSSVDNLPNTGTTPAASGGSAGPATIAGTLVLGGTAPRIITVNDGHGLLDLNITAVLGAASVNFQKDGAGRLALAGNSSAYAGTITLNGGETVVQNAGALGTTAGNTVVNSGFSLLIDGVSLAEPLSINNTGFGGQGALRQISGASTTLSGAVVLAGTANIAVDAGLQLIMSGAISGAFALNKQFLGTLQFAGTTSNTFTGTMQVQGGTLELNKTGGAFAIQGRLEAGNDSGAAGVGGINADVVRWLQSEQIAATATEQLVANTEGLMDFNGKTETVANNAVDVVFARIGQTSSGRYDLNGGTIILAGGTTQTLSTNTGGLTIAAPPAVIEDGTISLSNANTGFISISDTLAPVDFIISATFNNAGTGRIRKIGAGALALTGNNTATYNATTDLTAGTLVLNDASSLGNAAGTLAITGASTLMGMPGGPALVEGRPIALNAALSLRGPTNITLSGPLTNSVASNTITANMNAGNTATLSGTINLSNSAASNTLTVNNNTFGGGVNNTIVGGDVTISGQIVNGGTSTAGLLTKGGVGLVVLTNNTNSYAGTTTVAGGVLRVTSNGALGGTVAEQQTFGVTSPGGGSFTITYNGQITTPLSFTGSVPPTDVDVATALNALPSIARTGGVVSVVSSNPVGPGTTYTVTFGGLLAGVDVIQIASINFTAPAAAGPAIATTVGGAGGTFVNNTASLQVVPGLAPTEPLTLNNNGFGNFGALRMIDVTPGVTESTTWAGSVNFNANSTWAGVDGGGANADRLIITGTVVSGGAALIVKTGLGELEFGGNTDNGQMVFNGVSPNDDGLEIRQGTVFFNKPQVSGINYNAIVGGGRVSVGDGGGGANADRLVLIGTSLDQIGGAVPFTVGASGLFTMSGAATEQFPSTVTIQRLMGIAGNIDTTTRTMILGNNLDVANAGITSGATPAATIAGILDMGGANRSLNTADSFILNPAEDLVVSAVINGTAGNAVQKDGFGTLALTAANLYPGTTTINAATLDFNQSFNNGLNTFVNGTLVVRGAGTLGPGAVNVNSGATLILDNTAGIANRIADGAALTLAGSTFTLLGNSGAAVTETVGTLTINAGANTGTEATIRIDDEGQLTQLLAASLARGGSALVNLVGVDSQLQDDSNARIQITALPANTVYDATTATNGILPWATISGPGGTFDLVTDGDATDNAGPIFLERFTGDGNVYDTDVNALTHGVVRLTGVTGALTGARTFRGLLLENAGLVGGSVNLNGNVLTMGTSAPGLVVARGTPVSSIVNGGAAVGVDFGGREPLFAVEAGSTLNVSATLNGTATLRKERLGTLILAGDNDNGAGQTFSGALSVNAGTLQATHSDALGSEPGGTVTVNRRAALVLDSTGSALVFGNKALTLNGLGLNDDGSGTLVTIGSNAISVGLGTTVITPNTNPTIFSIGAAAPLSLDAVLAGTTNPVMKRGAGNLVFTGASGNTNTGAFSVNEGTVTLDKGGAVLAVNGAITINDLGNFDGAGPATLIYTGSSTNMVGDVVITVNPQGVFDINGKTDTVANTLNIQNGDFANTAGGGTFQVNALTMTGGTVNTGSGILNLNGNLTYNAGLSTGGQAVVNGNLNLVAGNRTITVNDGYQVNELAINALVSNGRLVKAGTGGLLLSNAANTFLTGVNEVQRIVIAGATAGTSQFNINFNGNVTSAITVNAVDATTAGLIDAALEALPSIGPGGVNVTVAAALTFNIEFTGHLGEQDVPNQITTAVVVGPGTFTPSTLTGGVAGINHTAGILSFSDDTALGTARVQMGSAQLLPVGGNRTLANSLTLLNNVTTVFGGRRDFGGTDDLTITGGVTLHSSVGTGQVINIDVNDNLTTVNFNGVISGGGDFIVPTKRGIGTLVWSGNNTFDVRDLTLVQTLTATDGIRVEGGILRIAHSNALGFSGELASVNVSGQNGAVLELDGSAGNINITGRILEMVHQNDAFSRGLLNRTSTLGVNSGVLRSLAGTNSITAAEFRLRNINDAANTGTIFIGVDAGSLTIDAQIVGMENDATATLANNKSISKTGLGSLSYSGATPNSYTGTTAVFNGTLVLNKSASIAAVAGPVVVGDNEGAANSDLLVLNSSEQIADGATVLVAGTGQLQASAAQAASLTNEVQQIQVGNAAPTGQFRLHFNGATTGDIAFGATPATIQAALNALATIGGAGGSVLVLGGSGQNQAFTVTFLGSLAGANQPQMKIVAGTTPYAVATLAVTTLTPGGLAGRETIGAPTLRIAAQGAGNIALQAGSTLALTGDVIVDTYGALPASALTGTAITGGTLDLRQTSAGGATINRNFTVADAPATDDLTITSIITDGAHGAVSNVNKAGGANSRLVIGGAVNTFTGQVSVTNGDLAITSAVALGAIRTDEVQSYIINNVLGNASGTYTLTTDQGVTAPLNFNSSADEVQAALETIYGAGNVRVVSAISGNTNVQYSIHWLPGARADYPITKFVPTSTIVHNTALSFANETAMDAVNGAAGTTNFEGLWSGFVTVAPADPLTWTFGTSSDDGSIVLIDLNNDGIYSPTERIVNNGGSHGVIQLTGNVTFPAAGNYRIAIGFFQGTGGGAMEARFAKSANATYAEQANINPGLAAQAGIWSDDASVANQLTNKWFNQAPTASGADLDPSIMPITLTNSTLVNASFGAVTTNQEGGQAAATNVAAGAALELRGGAGMTIVNEPLVLNGVGILNGSTRGLWNNAFQGPVGTGNLRNESGANVWQGNISGFGNIALVGTSAIGVDGGSLTSNGVTGTITNVLANAASLIKTGAGVLETAGNVSNGYTGNTSIQQGTFRLNKSGNNASIPGGEIIIGDGIGGDNADVLLYAPTAGGDQIINRVIRVSSTGLLNLNGIADTNNNAIVLDVGPTFSADVSTGAGVLINNNQFTVVSNAGTTAASVPATVAGIYDLNGATRNVDVREGNAPVELNISAVIQVTPVTGGITKIGRGTLAISGTNTYTGTTTINADSGTLLANTPATIVAISPYTVGAGSTLGGSGTITGVVTVNAVGSNLTVGGIINPGPNGPAPNNTGILTVNNNVIFNAGSRFQVDINGTTVGTNYDQLLIGGAGSVTITGNAAPNIANTATIVGTTGNGFVPVNGVDAFKVLSKTSGGAITVGANSFLSLVLPSPSQASPAFVNLGGKVYGTSYNVAVGLNDGNDFVLQAVIATRVWDGRIDSGAVNVANDWTLATNWVGDQAPFAGDDLQFTDVGLANGKNAPFNDFPANTAFSTINFGNTAGTYTVTGNAVTLNALTGGGVTSDNTTNVAVTNNLNIGLTTAAAPQTVTVKDGSTLNLGGNITLVALAPLTVTNGAGADANGSAVFGGSINGNSVLTVNLGGATADATFNGAIGGVTPLASISVTAVDDLSFNSTIATTGNVSQTAGTGATILSGGNVAGTLAITNESISLNGGTLTVVGAPTLTATLGSIADGNAAANNLTAPSLTATAVTGVNLDTTIVDLTATNTGAGNVTIDDADALNLLSVNVANGNAVITAGGALTDGAAATTAVSGNASFSGTTITLGDTAGDLFNAGSLTFISGGAVNISEDSATQLSGASTASSLVLNSTGALTNAAAASLAVTNNASFAGATITLGNQAGDVVNMASLTFNSAGPVSIAEDSSTLISGTNTALSLVLGSTGAITDAAAASVTVANNASFTGPSINLGAAAGDAINFGTLTFVASAGTVTVLEDSSLNLAGASTATGAIVLTTPDVAAAGQDITLPVGASLQSTGSTITFNPGDDAILAGNVSAATTITVNVDFGNADPLGGSATVSGVFTSPGGTFLVGNTNNDTFTVSPQATTTINVNGNAPTVAPGDVLNLNLTGTTNPVLTLGGPGAGAWSFDPPFQPVVYVSIENVNTVGATFYNLLLNANTSSFGNTNVDDQILLRRSGTDFIIERTGLSTPPDDDDVGQIFQGAMANILSFSYIGSADNDIVTVSDSGGMLDFLASVPGVTNNPNIAGAADFLFNGNGGNDSLIYNMTGATASQIYAMGSGTGAPGLEGEISSTSGGATLLTYFTNVESTQRIGAGATPGGLSVLGDLSANALTVAANGALTRTSAPGYTPFDFSGNNYSLISVSGLAGADTLELLSLGTGQTNNAAITLSGDADVDTLSVRTTSGSTGLVTLNGGAGSDLFQLFNASNTVDAIAGTVVVDGTDGNVAGNTDTLTIVDTGDITADNVLISALNPATSADYAIEGINTVVGNDVIFRNVDVLNYTATQGNDTLDTRLVNTTPPHDLSVVTINGWLGGDQFLLFTSDQGGGTGAGVTPNGIASGVASINLNGDAPGNPHPLDGNDIFGQTAPGLVGTGSGNVGLVVPDTIRGIRPSASTGITINGGEPTGPAVPTGDTVGDVLNLDVSGLPGSAALVLPTLNGVVATTGFQPVAYSQIEDINLIINNQLINVQMGDVFVRGTAGVDLIQFMRAPTLLDPNHTRARVNSLVVDFTLTGKTVAYAGASNDYITQANLTQPAEMYGEAGDDYISGAMGNDFLVGGLGADQINASGGDNIVWGDDSPNTAVPQPQDLAVGGGDSLSALGGNDVFYGGGGDDSVSAGGGNDYAYGGQGNDTLDGNDGDDRLYGGVGNDTLGGYAGNDLLSGGSGDDQLLGGTGNDILFGGTGADSISGGDGNDLLVTGSVGNEASSWTSLSVTSTYNAATYTNPADNDAALITLLAQWGGAGNRASIAGITHDGVDDDVFGGIDDDDFCWETADIMDDFPAANPADFSSFGMGTDERFGPTS